MRRILATLLAGVMVLTGCAQSGTVLPDNSEISDETLREADDGLENTPSSKGENSEEAGTVALDGEEEIDFVSESEDGSKIEEFQSLNDPRLLQYVEDTVYTGLVDQYQSENYVIENVNAIYISEDYLEEVAYNSKANIFFGYNLEDLDKQFMGTPYVFTLGDDGQTKVVPFEDYDDTYDQIINNVAVGTGVILVCVTVSVVSGGAGAVPCSMVFAAAAKTGTTVALSSGAISAIFAGAVTGIQTKDFDQALTAAALQGSNGFKWGAITGALTGGIGEANSLRNAAKAAKNGQTILDGNAPAWRQAEQRALSKYGGEEQVTFLNGEEVPFGTPGATRPDIVRQIGNHQEAIEVKYYNLESSGSRSTLYKELEREVADRVTNMPQGTTQRVVLDVTNRDFSPTLVQEVERTIQTRLSSIYPNIPIDIVR